MAVLRRWQAIPQSGLTEAVSVCALGVVLAAADLLLAVPMIDGNHAAAMPAVSFAGVAVGAVGSTGVLTGMRRSSAVHVSVGWLLLACVHALTQLLFGRPWLLVLHMSVVPMLSLAVADLMITSLVGPQGHQRNATQRVVIHWWRFVPMVGLLTCGLGLALQPWELERSLNHQQLVYIGLSVAIGAGLFAYPWAQVRASLLDAWSLTAPSQPLKLYACCAAITVGASAAGAPFTHAWGAAALLMVILIGGGGGEVSLIVLTALLGSLANACAWAWNPYPWTHSFGPGSIAVIMGLAGFIGRWSASMVDHHQRLLADARLSETAFRHASVGLAVLDRPMDRASHNDRPSDRSQVSRPPVLRAVNTAFCALSGRSEAELLNRPLSDIAGPGEAWPAMAAAIAFQPIDTEIVTTRTDGTSIRAHLSARPVKSVAGMGVHGSMGQASVLQFRDVTREREAQELLANSERRFRGLFDAGPILMWQHDITDSSVLINAAAREQLDVFSSLLTVDEFVHYLNPVDRAIYQEWAQWHDEPFPIEFRFCGRRGERCMLVSVVRVESDLGRRMLIGCAIDVQDRKDLEDQLVDLSRTLDRRVRDRTAEIESFAYSVSHDLRAPLRAIGGYAQLIREDHAGLLPDEGQRFLAEIERNANRMGQLLDGLLKLARLSVTNLSRVPVDMMRLSNEVFADLRPQDRQVRFHADPMPLVSGDVVLLRQLLVNLIGNALKFTRPRGDDSEIRISHEDGWFVLRDNGVGFDPTYVDRLFGVFERLHSEQAFEGHGIGLALVQRIVQRHGGEIVASSMPERGAVFRFKLPLAG